MISYLSLVFFVFLSAVQASEVTSLNTTNSPVHNITHFANLRFENLAIRRSGQILTTTTAPNASIYQVDPLNILPPTLIYTIPNIGSAAGIVEGRPDIFYVVSGNYSLRTPIVTVPDSYIITEIDMHEVFVQPDGSLTRQPGTRTVARLPDAAVPNGAAFARQGSDYLLVADSFRGLIWNVNVCDGSVGIALNDTTTKGSAPTGPAFKGANGIKVHDGNMYWTSTGRSALYKVAIDERGNVRPGDQPTLVADKLSCDDFDFDWHGNAFVAGPLDIITRVSPTGEKLVVAGTFNSTHSDLLGPTAI